MSGLRRLGQTLKKGFSYDFTSERNLLKKTLLKIDKDRFTEEERETERVKERKR